MEWLIRDVVPGASASGGIDRTRCDVANRDVFDGQAGSSPLQLAERLCSGKLPACHYRLQGEFVVGSERSESDSLAQDDGYCDLPGISRCA